MKKQITVGVIGCGYWGPLLIRNFKSLSECRLKSVCDLDITRVKHACALYPDVEGLTATEQLIDAVDINAIVIATPVKTHFSLAKASLLAGKHTFIEKPMATSSGECEELIDIAERNGLVLMVDHTFLYSAPVRKIAEIVQAGDLGEIRYINSRRLNLGLFQKDINVAWDLAPHARVRASTRKLARLAGGEEICTCVDTRRRERRGSGKLPFACQTGDRAWIPVLF